MRGPKICLLVVAGVSIAAGLAAAPARRSGARPAAKPPAARSAAQSQQAVGAIMSQIVDRVWERGDYYWHNGRYTDRIATDRLVIAMEPTFLEPYITIGFLLENTGKDAEALKSYLRATQVAPHEWQPWHEIGWYHLQRKQYPQAIRYYEIAVTKKGPPVWVWKNLAHAYERHGDLKKSLATWEKARYIDAADGAIDVNVKRIEEKLKAQEGRRERG